ncbi:MAG: FHA domain-containing protein [Oscillatoriales cyanobacterium SM2_2_1]|nr:FHA domain-containing protein [Oscillatoriales cyanobacterium SM2_2_1]
MITLHLLHPSNNASMQTWQFEAETVVRIGRAADNDIVLYSSVVSRHHTELRHHAPHWDVVNIGANGTFLEGTQIEKERVFDGMIIRLALTGPRLQIHL